MENEDQIEDKLQSKEYNKIIPKIILYLILAVSTWLVLQIYTSYFQHPNFVFVNETQKGNVQYLEYIYNSIYIVNYTLSMEYFTCSVTIQSPNLTFSTSNIYPNKNETQFEEFIITQTHPSSYCNITTSQFGFRHG